MMDTFQDMSEFPPDEHYTMQNQNAQGQPRRARSSMINDDLALVGTAPGQYYQASTHPAVHFNTTLGSHRAPFFVDSRHNQRHTASNASATLAYPPSVSPGLTSSYSPFLRGLDSATTYSQLATPQSSSRSIVRSDLSPVTPSLSANTRLQQRSYGSRRPSSRASIGQTSSQSQLNNSVLPHQAGLLDPSQYGPQSFSGSHGMSVSPSARQSYAVYSGPLYDQGYGSYHGDYGQVSLPPGLSNGAPSTSLQRTMSNMTTPSSRGPDLRRTSHSLRVLDTSVNGDRLTAGHATLSRSTSNSTQGRVRRRGPYTCPECATVFTDAKKFERHPCLRFGCPYCDSTVSRKEYVHRHICKGCQGITPAQRALYLKGKNQQRPQADTSDVLAGPSRSNPPPPAFVGMQDPTSFSADQSFLPSQQYGTVANSSPWQTGDWTADNTSIEIDFSPAAQEWQQMLNELNPVSSQQGLSAGSSSFAPGGSSYPDYAPPAGDVFGGPSSGTASRYGGQSSSHHFTGDYDASQWYRDDGSSNNFSKRKAP